MCFGTCGRRSASPRSGWGSTRGATARSSRSLSGVSRPRPSSRCFASPSTWASGLRRSSAWWRRRSQSFRPRGPGPAVRYRTARCYKWSLVTLPAVQAGPKSLCSPMSPARRRPDRTATTGSWDCVPKREPVPHRFGVQGMAWDTPGGPGRGAFSLLVRAPSADRSPGISRSGSWRDRVCPWVALAAPAARLGDSPSTLAASTRGRKGPATRVQ